MLTISSYDRQASTCGCLESAPVATNAVTPDFQFCGSFFVMVVTLWTWFFVSWIFSCTPNCKNGKFRLGTWFWT